MTFNDIHIAALDAIVGTKERDTAGDLVLTTSGWLGSACRAWAEAVSGVPQERLPAARQDRRSLRSLVQGTELSDDEALLAVMAWGGQRRDHGRSTWASVETLGPVVQGLRTGALNRRAGYDAFFEATTRQNNRVVGLGPAYYSKLLFFLPPASTGPIMDQWTAKSMQLLVDRRDASPIVTLSHAGYVTRGNTAEVYEQFCSFVAALAKRYGISDGNAEELIFAGSQQPWRTYVRTHWRHRV